MSIHVTHVEVLSTSPIGTPRACNAAALDVEPALLLSPRALSVLPSAAADDARVALSPLDDPLVVEEGEVVVATTSSYVELADMLSRRRLRQMTMPPTLAHSGESLFFALPAPDLDELRLRHASALIQAFDFLSARSVRGGQLFDGDAALLDRVHRVLSRTATINPTERAVRAMYHWRVREEAKVVPSYIRSLGFREAALTDLRARVDAYGLFLARRLADRIDLQLGDTLSVGPGHPFWYPSISDNDSDTFPPGAIPRLEPYTPSQMTELQSTLRDMLG